MHSFWRRCVLRHTRDHEHEKSKLLTVLVSARTAVDAVTKAEEGPT